MRCDQMPRPFAPEATLPCPFCGSDDISDGEVLVEINGSDFKQSECMKCGAIGPRAHVIGADYGDVAAIAAWNTRPPSPGAAGGGR